MQFQQHPLYVVCLLPVQVSEAHQGMQRRVPLGVGGVKLGPPLEQHVHHVHVEGQGRDGQGQLPHHHRVDEAWTHRLEGREGGGWLRDVLRVNAAGSVTKTPRQHIIIL